MQYIIEQHVNKCALRLRMNLINITQSHIWDRS